jgi:hypothetical protein
VKTLLLTVALLAGQMNTFQQKPVVHLRANQDAIEQGFGGKLLELIHAPSVIRLPVVPPKLDGDAKPWSVDIKNLGPEAVTVLGKGTFSANINVGQTIHVHSNGTAYSLMP